MTLALPFHSRSSCSVAAKASLAACAASAMSLVCTAGAYGLTLRVPSEYPTIQAGIDAAIHGDTVLVGPGTYTGLGNRDIRFNGKGILVRSEAGSAVTIVDCQGSASEPHRGFDFYSTGETNEAVLDGFTITNGYAAGAGPYQKGGGIRIYAANPRIENCIVTACSSDGAGSAVFVYSGTAVLYRCSFLDNSDSSACVEVFVVGLIEECLIANNGGVGMRLGEQSEVVRTTIAANRANGVHLLVGHNSVMRGCLITGNVGSGILVEETVETTIDGCTITGNRGSTPNAGIRVGFNVSDLLIRNTIVRGNCSSDVRICCFSDLTLECCAFDPDLVFESGGDITFSGPQVTTDPMFCAPEACLSAPTTEGNYHLQQGSPCLPNNNPCAVLIGALGEGCSPTNAPDSPGSWPDASTRWVLQTAPNPVHSDAVVHVVLNGLGVASWFDLRVFDVTGSLRVQETGALEPGEQDVIIPTRGLQAGTYFVRIRSAGAEGRARFLVVR